MANTLPFQVLEQLTKIRQDLAITELLTPSNLDEVRRDFLAKPTQNPVFKYEEVPTQKLTEQLRIVTSLDIPEISNLETWLVSRKHFEVRTYLELLLYRGQSEFGHISEQLFNCHFSPIMLEHAKQDAQLPVSDTESETYQPMELIQKIQEYLLRYNINDWQIAVSTSSDFYIRVKSTNKTVWIGNHPQFVFSSLDTTLAHEIDGHVLRAVNAAQQSAMLLTKALPLYIKTEEGLASFLGDYCADNGSQARKHHAIKYLAGHLAREASFIDVFEYMVAAGLSPDLAFQRTFRLKRGYSDSSQPGCFAKEAMYYEGLQEVKQFLDTGGDAQLLYVGKVGLADLPWIRTSQKNIIPTRLTNYLKTR